MHSREVKALRPGGMMTEDASLHAPAGKFLESIVTDTCQQSLPQVCKEAGGVIKSGVPCNFACQALSSQGRASCKTDSDCLGGSVDVCESQTEVTFALSGLCCSYIYRIAQEHCSGVDCKKLDNFISTLRAKVSI